MDGNKRNMSGGGQKAERMCRRYFGVSCVVAMRLLSETIKVDEKWSEFRDKVILFGLLVLRISDEEMEKLSEKLEDGRREIEELKRLRHEEAKANEKVISIFASREQNWLSERKKLRFQIEALMKELRVMEKKAKETEELGRAKEELEEKLVKAEKEVEELSGKREKEAEEHAAELWKQKTVCLELVSSQRWLEAELSRLNKQNVSKSYELDLVLGQQEESVMLSQKLSSENLKLRRELEQKDRILSMMIGKSKRKKTEMDKERRRTERQSLRSMFRHEAGDEEHHCEADVESNRLRSLEKSEVRDRNLKSTGQRGDESVRKQLTSQLKRLTDTSWRSKNSVEVEMEIRSEESICSDSMKLSSKINPPSRMDIPALGISYKIKRLQQNLMMLERYSGKQAERKEIDHVNGDDVGKRALLLLLPLLSRQVTRYHSLQEKTVDLCNRMHVNGTDNHRNVREKGEGKTALEEFLEETFQLQRYIVAMGQKLIEIQAKIASGFSGDLLEDNASSSSSSSSALSHSSSSSSLSCSNSSSSFDLKRFGESMKNMFQEVQRGIEVRISRIIGDLEGTLAREGMMRSQRR